MKILIDIFQIANTEDWKQGFVVINHDHSKTKLVALNGDTQFDEL
jgi:hypothetical protein